MEKIVKFFIGFIWIITILGLFIVVDYMFGICRYIKDFSSLILMLLPFILKFLIALIKVSIVLFGIYSLFLYVKRKLDLKNKNKKIDEKYKTKISSMYKANTNVKPKGYFNIKKNNGHLYFSNIYDSNKIEKIVICPKCKEQLYRLPAGCYIRINKKIYNIELGEVLLVKPYNSYTDEIVVSLCSNLYSDESNNTLDLKVNDVLEALNINHGRHHYFYKKIMCQRDKHPFIYSLNLADTMDEMFRLYIPYAFDYSDKDAFIEDVSEELKINIEDKDKIGDIYDFFFNIVNPYLRDYFMCFIDKHEFKKVYLRNAIIKELTDMYNVCKAKLPWITERTIKEYILRIWIEKASVIYTKDGMGIDFYSELRRDLSKAKLSQSSKS